MASIDSIISTAQSLASSAANNATAMYNQAIAAAEAAHAVDYKTVPAIGALDELTPDNAPEFTATFSAPDTSGLGSPSAYDDDVVAQRSYMKSFVAGGMTDFIASFAPNYSTLRADLEAKISDGLTGGTAISDVIEAQIYARARDRIDAENTAAELQLSTVMSRRGYPLPAGILAAGLQQVRKDAFDRIANSATEVAINRAQVENEFAKVCIQASQALNLGVQQSLLAYAGIVATVNEATLKYAAATIQVIDTTVKTKLAVASAQYDADSNAYKNAMLELQTNIENLVKKLTFQFKEAELILDQAKAQTSADVQLEQVEAQLHMNKVSAMVNAANAGAGPQASIASAAISTGNTLVQQTEE
jgi:hypothetical protein